MAETIRKVIKRATREITRSRAIDHWQDGREQEDAEVLLSYVIDTDVDDLDFTAKITGKHIRRFQKLVDRRVTGEPVPLITGEFEFRGLRLKTRPGVFVPRYSSEQIVDRAIAVLRRRRDARIAVDVCTGAGPIPLAIVNEVARAEAYGVDIAVDAIDLASENARSLGLRKARFFSGDMLAPLPRRLKGKVALFTMHPPYVARLEVDLLPSEIRKWEPQHTLTDESDDGLGLTRRLSDEALMWLAPRGKILIEIGPHLSRKAANIFRRAGYNDVTVTKDEVGATHLVEARGSQN